MTTEIDYTTQFAGECIFADPIHDKYQLPNGTKQKITKIDKLIMLSEKHPVLLKTIEKYYAKRADAFAKMIELGKDFCSVDTINTIKSNHSVYWDYDTIKLAASLKDEDVGLKIVKMIFKYTDGNNEQKYYFLNRHIQTHENINRKFIAYLSESLPKDNVSASNILTSVLRLKKYETALYLLELGFQLPSKLDSTADWYIKTVYDFIKKYNIENDVIKKEYAKRFTVYEEMGITSDNYKEFMPKVPANWKPFFKYLKDAKIQVDIDCLLEFL